MAEGEGPLAFALANQQGSIARLSTLVLKTNKAKSTNAPQPSLDKEFHVPSLRLQLAQAVTANTPNRGTGTPAGTVLRRPRGRLARYWSLALEEHMAGTCVPF